MNMNVFSFKGNLYMKLLKFTLNPKKESLKLLNTYYTQLFGHACDNMY